MWKALKYKSIVRSKKNTMYKKKMLLKNITKNEFVIQQYWLEKYIERRKIKALCLKNTHKYISVWVNMLTFDRLCTTNMKHDIHFFFKHNNHII